MIYATSNNPEQFEKGMRVRFEEQGNIYEGFVRQVGMISTEGDQVIFVTPERVFSNGTIGKPHVIYPRLFTNGRGLTISQTRNIPPGKPPSI